MGLTRREFLARSAAASVAFTLAAAGCSGADAGSSDLDGDTSWSVAADDALPILTTQVSGGAVVAMPGNAWFPQDGYIHLQLSGGSIPGHEIDSARRDGKKLLVVLKSQDGPQTMDLVLTEYRAEPQGPDAGTVADIESVTVDFGHGDVRDLDQAYGPA